MIGRQLAIRGVVVVQTRPGLGHAERVGGLKVAERVERHEQPVVVAGIVATPHLADGAVRRGAHPRADVDRLLIEEEADLGANARSISLIVSLLEEIVAKHGGRPGGVVEPSVHRHGPLTGNGPGGLGGDSNRSRVQRLSVRGTREPARAGQKQDRLPSDSDGDLVHPSVPQRLRVLEVERVRPVPLVAVHQALSVDVGDRRANPLAVVVYLDRDGLARPRPIPGPPRGSAAIARLVVSLERPSSVRAELRHARRVASRRRDRPTLLLHVGGTGVRSHDPGLIHIGTGRDPGLLTRVGSRRFVLFTCRRDQRHDPGRRLGRGEPGVRISKPPHAAERGARRIRIREVPDSNPVATSPALDIDREPPFEEVVDPSGLDDRRLGPVADRDLDLIPPSVLRLGRRRRHAGDQQRARQGGGLPDPAVPGHPARLPHALARCPARALDRGRSRKSWKLASRMPRASRSRRTSGSVSVPSSSSRSRA